MADAPFAPRPIDTNAVQAAFDNAAPFKHAIIDNFFAPSDALALHRSFPVFSRAEETKARLFAGRVYGPPPIARRPAFGAACSALAAPAFVRCLSEISGIRQLAMDQTHAGAGAHVGLRGSSLPIHADHNTHPNAPWLYRRLNILVYLNPNWDASWHSNLLLYDRSGSKLVLEIEPRFNRAVLMDVHDHAFHGYHPLQVPAGQTRQVLASYFYSPEPSPDQATEPHPTILASPSDIRIGQRVATRVQRVLLRSIKNLAPAPKWPDDLNIHA